MDFTICRFLGHDCHDNLPSLEWRGEMQVAAHAHLLNRWLDEDATASPTHSGRLLVDVRDCGGPLDAGSLVKCGLFPTLSPDGPAREPLSCEPTGVHDAILAVRQAILAHPPTRRLKMLSAALGWAILDVADEAALVTVADAAGDETHAVFSSGSRVIRVSVTSPASPGNDRDPACSFAGHWCEARPALHDDDLALAEARLRAVCAGTILRAPLDLDGYAAFRIDLAGHTLPPDPDLASVRRWWRSTAWSRRYGEEYFEDEFPWPDDPQAQEFVPDDDADPWDPLDLGDPAASDAADGWMLGMGPRSLSTPALLAEVEAFSATCRRESAGHAAGELVPYLLHELIDEPLWRVSGPQGRLLVWADADEGGRFWRTADGDLDRYGEARRLLVVGPREALYVVFKDEKNC
ncbi:hypothetical protein HCN51_42340 [Nonomuraea sp. FMUSA5-5]|uniref:Uncharacterized protein n=1 Tax=Nonomuraea composti TaxID=2720023 RepID=A0ABX1BJP4_9ACTN|nr:hypothetical protein [Nonomuraea sp. FMUSA5-5]NJP96004.1 hypothetical protein [Nonomuraea sp. FMUSA5-5]